LHGKGGEEEEGPWRRVRKSKGKGRGQPRLGSKVLCLDPENGSLFYHDDGLFNGLFVGGVLRGWGLEY
jgi:hypothetical protein